MDDERDRMAEQLMRAEMGYKPNPFYPTRAPKLSDLWPCDQEKYRLMADVALSTANNQVERPR
jgi:hypothetical protein